MQQGIIFDREQPNVICVLSGDHEEDGGVPLCGEFFLAFSSKNDGFYAFYCEELLAARSLEAYSRTSIARATSQTVCDRHRTCDTT